MRRPEPVFEKPWHAQAFALAVALNEAGHFAWSDWARAFGATLRRRGLERDLDGGDDYFAAWLETLEKVVADCGAADAAAIHQITEEWRQAFLSTPHGQPVTLRK